MKISSIILLTLITFGVSSFKSADNSEIKFYTSLEEAKTVAAKENKPIFMDVYATWCGPCKKMDKDVFNNTEVASYFNENFINVKMDIEKNEGPAIQQKYKINAVPTLLFMSAEGKVKQRAMGYTPKKTLLSIGKEVKANN